MNWIRLFIVVTLHETDSIQSYWAPLQWQYIISRVILSLDHHFAVIALTPILNNVMISWLLIIPGRLAKGDRGQSSFRHDRELLVICQYSMQQIDLFNLVLILLLDVEKKKKESHGMEKDIRRKT